MPSDSLAQLLTRLEEAKRDFTTQSHKRTAATIAALTRRRFTDAQSLIRFHEALLFFCAYPPSASILQQSERALAIFAERIERLREMDIDFTPFEEGEVSGIVGTTITSAFSYPIARWLGERHSTEAVIDWNGYEGDARLAATFPRFLPLLEDDSFVEAHVPYNVWLQAAEGRAHLDLPWLIKRFDALPQSEQDKAELYDSLKLWIRWDFTNYKVTRTGLRHRTRKIFYHREPLLKRSDVSIARELAGPPLPIKKLSHAQGATFLALARAASAPRYRELYGFTHGDTANVLRADAGRGVELFVFGIPPAKRLPLRAYHAAMIFKNGVPVGYVEGLSFFERMEIGFNLYYTFRDGETAWLYARLMRLFNQLLNVTAFSIDPYQVGHENEEGIESGAFWFYRKLGFRPTRPEIAELMQTEEAKIAKRLGYRTTARTLRRLAAGHLIYEATPALHGDWDNFQTRNLGLAIARRMGQHFDGDATKIRHDAIRTIARTLNTDTSRWNAAEQRALADLSLILSLVPDLPRWTQEEKRTIARIIRAKASADEALYVRLLQQSTKLRAAIIKIGS